MSAARTWAPFARWAAISALVLAVALVTYWAAISMRYGRLDDYVYVQLTRQESRWDFYVPFNLDMGRPIPGWLTGGILPGAATVAELVRLRVITTSLLALSGAVAAAMSLYLTRAASGWPRYAAALGVGLTPLGLTSSPSTATWAILVGALHAFSTAMLAGLLVAWGHRLWWIPSAALLLVTAFSYQQIVPLAMLPALLVTAVAFARREAVRWWRPIVVGVTGVASLSLNAAFLLSRDGMGASRVGQGTWAERTDWYVHAFLPVAFDLQVPSSPGGAVWSGILALALACTPLVLGVRHAALPVALALATAGCALVVLPLEMWASYRLASPTQFCVWVGAASCVAYTIAYVRWRVVSWFGLLAAAALLVPSLVAAHDRAVDYLAAPNQRDWANVRCVVGNGRDFEPTTKWYAAPIASSTSPVVVADEYGIVASVSTWALQAQLWLAEDVVDGPGIPGWTAPADVLPIADPPEPGRQPFPVGACAP